MRHKKIKKLKKNDFRKQPRSGYAEKNPRSKRDAKLDRPGTKIGK